MKRRSFIVAGGATLLLGGVAAYGWRRSVGSMPHYADYSARLRVPLPTDPTANELIRYATLAANSHNTQPWRFRSGDGIIDILPDFSRATHAVDPDDHHLFVGLGCAAENLAVAAAATGRPGEAYASAEGSVRFTYSSGAAQADALFAAIPQRQSTRAEYDGRSVSAAALETMRKAAEMTGVRLVLLTERARIDRLRDLVVAGNDAQMHDPAFMAELKHWLRFNPRSAVETGDGLFAAASGNPVLPDAIGRLAFDAFFTAKAENDKYARHIDSSVGIAVFFAERADKAHWISIGRACQRFALTATSLGLKHAFINQPVETARLRPELAALAGESSLRPDIVMRFGYGPALPFSPRRPVKDVLI